MTGRIAIVCNGSVPGSRLPSGAQGLRAQGLHLGLNGAGRACDIVTRESTVQAQLKRWSAPSMRFPAHWRVMKDAVMGAHLRKDYAAVIFIGWVGLDAFESGPDQTIVYDFFSPSMVEHDFISSGGRLEGKRRKKNALLAQASIIIANGHGRAEYGAEYMAADAALSHLPRPVSVRLALPWRPPTPPGKGPLRVFFGGFDQAWTKGLDIDALEAIAALDGVEVTAVGVGEHLHFRDRKPEHSFAARSRIHRHDVCALGEYRALNGASHIALDVFERNVERELCYSTRAVTSLCNGCPVVTMAFTEVGRLVAETGAGWVLETFTLSAVTELLEHLVRNRDEVAERTRNTRKFWELYGDPAREILPLLEVL